MAYDVLPVAMFYTHNMKNLQWKLLDRKWGVGGSRNWVLTAYKEKIRLRGFFVVEKWTPLNKDRVDFKSTKLKYLKEITIFKEMSSNLCEEFSTFLQINWFTGLHQMVHLMDHEWGIFYNIPNLLIVLQAFSNRNFVYTFIISSCRKETIQM